MAHCQYKKSKYWFGEENLYIEKWWIIHNGPKQQIAMMFYNYKNMYGDDNYMKDHQEGILKLK
jgi:hypothetical protein